MPNQPDIELARRIVSFLNSLLENDRPAVAAMFANRTPCSEFLANHPTVQVARRHGGFDVGVLGLLNGLCGIHDDGNGSICSIYDKESDSGFHNLQRFSITHEERRGKS